MALLPVINAEDPRPIYVQVMDEVRRAVLVGALRPDEALPSIRDLAVELRVNANTIKQAYRELEGAGIVYVKRGEGTFVARRAVSDAERQAAGVAICERAVREGLRFGIAPKMLLVFMREAVAASAATAADVGKAS